MNAMDRPRLIAVTLARVGGVFMLLMCLGFLAIVLVALKEGDSISPFLWGVIALTAVGGVVSVY